MDFRSGLSDFLEIDISFELSKVNREGCAYAQLFSEWVGALWEDIVSEEPDPVRINQAKVLLQDKWHEFRRRVPKSHRTHVSDVGHTCIWHVYEQAFWNLDWLQMKITPPLLFLPAGKPPQFPRAEFKGTIIGLEE